MKIGDTVRWASQAQGVQKEKVGVVIAEIIAGCSARECVPSTAKKSHIKFSNDKSVYDRILVEVKGGAKGDIKYYYAPSKRELLRQGNQ